MNKFAKFLLFFLPVGFFAVEYNVHELPWIKAKDKEAIYFAAPFLPKNPVIIEAGLGHGDDTVLMKKKWPNATMYCFEPHPWLFSIAQNNTRMLRDVHLYPYVLYDYVGEISFNLSAKIPEASSVHVDNLDHIKFPDDLEWSGNFRDTMITVKCTTINHWAAEHNVKKVDYIWLDAEGAELAILKNATDILSTVRVISTEANFIEFRKGITFFEPLYKFLTEQGFVLKFIWGRPDWQAVAVFVNAKYLDF